MTGRPARLAVAVVAGIAIGTVFDAVVERAVPAGPARAVAYVVVTIVLAVLVSRTFGRGRA